MANTVKPITIKKAKTLIADLEKIKARAVALASGEEGCFAEYSIDFISIDECINSIHRAIAEVEPD